MYARVTTWEGGEAEEMRASVAEINARATTGPPEGVTSAGFTLLFDAEGGRAFGIGLFETEADYAQGDAVLNAMDPPGGGMGRRVSVEKYEVGVDVRP
jgi:hypothetical protein